MMFGDYIGIAVIAQLEGPFCHNFKGYHIHGENGQKYPKLQVNDSAEATSEVINFL